MVISVDGWVSNPQTTENLGTWWKWLRLSGKREGLRKWNFPLFTDNCVAEQAFYSGTSDSPALFKLVLWLCEIEMSGDIILHIIHISGKRMIKSGIDGLSRGDTNEGIAAGHALLRYVNLHRSVVARSPGIVDWFQSWWPVSEL